MKMERARNLSGGERILRFGAGMMLATSVLAINGPLGWAAILPLIGIYPALTAFTGYDPAVALMDEVLSGWNIGNTAAA